MTLGPVPTGELFICPPSPHAAAAAATASLPAATTASPAAAAAAGETGAEWGGGGQRPPSVAHYCRNFAARGTDGAPREGLRGRRVWQQLTIRALPLGRTDRRGGRGARTMDRIPKRQQVRGIPPRTNSGPGRCRRPCFTERVRFREKMQGAKQQKV